MPRPLPRIGARCGGVAAFLVLLLSAVIPAACAQGPLVPVEVCVTSRIAREVNTQHARFAAEYFAPIEAPLLNVTARIIGQYQEGARTTANDLARSFILNGSATCDIVIGTGSSLISPVFSPIVDVLWIDYSATSSRLTDTELFPFFNRVNPSTVQGTAALAALAIEFGWEVVNLVGYNDEIGATTIAGFTNNLILMGGRPGISLNIDPTSSRDDFVRGLDAIAASESSIVFFSSTLEQAPFVWLMELDPATNDKYRHLTYLFAQSTCGNAVATWTSIPGAFCINYATNDTRFGPFYQSYLARDADADEAALVALGWPPLDAVQRTGSGTFGIYAADATRYALRVYNSYVAQHNGTKMPRGSLDLVNFTREHPPLDDGFSGRIDLDANGDRRFTQTVIMNARPGNTTVDVADGSGAVVTVRPNMSFYFSNGVGLRSSVANAPSWRRVALAAAPSPILDTTQIILVAVGSAVVALLLIGLVLHCCQGDADGRSSTDAVNAPQDAAQPFTIVFTDIQASTLLWASAPEQMGPAVDQHHAIMRQLVRDLDGYEVKTIGDAFMVAFRDVGNAVRFAASIQTMFHKSDWGTDSFDEVYKDIDAGIVAEMQESNEASLSRSTMARQTATAARFIEDHELLMGSYGEKWNGLRVRVGLNTGVGTIKLDPTTHRYDYYGTVVNTAARVEGLATGGQVLMSRASYDALKQQNPAFIIERADAQDMAEDTGFPAGSDAKVIASPMGRHEVRGLVDGVEVLQVDPVPLRARCFPPIGKSLSGDVDNDLDVELHPEPSSTAIELQEPTPAHRDGSSSPKAFPSPAGMTVYSNAGDDDSITSPRAPPSLELRRDESSATIDLSSGGPVNRARLQRRTLDLLAVRNGAEFAESVTEHHKYLLTVLSTLPAKQRVDIMRSIADGWRVGGDIGATPSAGGGFFRGRRGSKATSFNAEADTAALAFDVAAKVETAHRARKGGTTTTTNAARQAIRRRSSAGGLLALVGAARRASSSNASFAEPNALVTAAAAFNGVGRSVADRRDRDRVKFSDDEDDDDSCRKGTLPRVPSGGGGGNSTSRSTPSLTPATSAPFSSEAGAPPPSGPEAIDVTAHPRQGHDTDGLDAVAPAS